MDFICHGQYERIDGMAVNANFHKAKSAKNDEFYTQLTDVEKELIHYTEHFRDKVIYCNCDEPQYSAFWKYFHLNFSALGLKKLISTHYDCTQPTYKMEYEGGNDNDIEAGVKTPLEGNGDFRNQECRDSLDGVDIVVTNPPFSLFREYVSILMEHNKDFLIIGNMNALHYVEIFPLIMSNKIWLGISAPKEFDTPNGLTKKISGLTRWFTNLDIDKHQEKLVLWKTYNTDEYPKFDNYDAINVDKVANIPADYDGVMGVPITFMDSYNPDQFEILGYTSDSSIGEDNPLRLHPNSYYDGYVWKCGKNKDKDHRLSSWMPLLSVDGFGGTKCTKDGCPDLYQMNYRILIRRKDGK